jgi:TolB protein
MTVDGSQSKRLTPPGWDGRMSDFDWSPDGKHIVFSSGYPISSSEVYIIDIENESMTNLTNNQVYDSGPKWSPDGRHIAFISDRQGDMQVYVIDVQTLEQTRISDEAVGASWGVDWSPDGHYLSFVSVQGHDQVLHVLNLETGVSKTWPNFEIIYSPLWWSPNSQYLIYERTEDWNGDGYGEVKLWVLRVDDDVEWAVSSPK